DEPAFAEEDVDAEAAESLRGVVTAELRADAAHPRHHRAEVGGRRSPWAQPARLRARELGERPRRANHRFRRHATDVEAVSAHEMALDERDLGTEPCGSCS